MSIFKRNRYYMFNRILFVLFVFVFFPAHSDANIKNWSFYKTSAIDLNGKSNPKLIDIINTKYAMVNILFDGNKLLVKDKYLQSPEVCYHDYVIEKKTALSYYFSQKSVDIYNNVFARSDIPFLQSVDVLSALNPDYECPPPYDEFVQVGDYITLVEQYYIVFFKAEAEGDNKSKRMLSYCHDEKLSQEFDGRSKMTCDFEGMSLEKSYQIMISSSHFDKELLKSRLPSRNINYKHHNWDVSYIWDGTMKLKITAQTDSEIYIYNFYYNELGTKLILETNSQY